MIIKQGELKTAAETLDDGQLVRSYPNAYFRALRDFDDVCEYRNFLPSANTSNDAASLECQFYHWLKDNGIIEHLALVRNVSQWDITDTIHRS